MIRNSVFTLTLLSSISVFAGASTPAEVDAERESVLDAVDGLVEDFSSARCNRSEEGCSLFLRSRGEPESEKISAASSPAVQQKLEKKVAALRQKVDALRLTCDESKRKGGQFDVPSRNCSSAVDDAGEVLKRAGELFSRWQALRGGASDWLERLGQPVGPSLADKELDLPTRYRECYSDFRRPRCWVANPQEIFLRAHPSRFVFLRKDATDTRETPAFRDVRKGEVLLLHRLNVSEKPRKVTSAELFTLDGVLITVDPGELASAPIAGAPPVQVRAADLIIFASSDHEWLAGPATLKLDTTGFDLGHKPVWLDWLEPAEPRTQQFFDAQSKIVACHSKQLQARDPTGELRRYYNVVTFDRRTGSPTKMESAAAKLDRDACSACNCKSFNELKRKLAVAAVTPAQQKLYEQLEPAAKRVAALKFDPNAKALGREPGDRD